MIRKRRRRQDTDSESSFEFGDFSYSPEPEVTPWLEPTGIPGFYQSPVEPVDPSDCERWPDSPYCGGNPINGNPLNPQNFADLGREFTSNPCETCLTISPVLGAIRLPPYTICRRSSSPECQVPQVPGEMPKPDYPPLPAGGIQPIPLEPGSLAGACAGEIYLITLLGTIDPGIAGGIGGSYSRADGTASTYEFYGPILGAWVEKRYTDPFYGYSNWYFFIECGGPAWDLSPPHWFPSPNQGFRKYGYYVFFSIYPEGGINLTIDIQRADGRLFDACDNPDNDARPPQDVDTPPYPLELNEECCMACGESEELLRLIARRLGTNDYPFTVPQSLLADRGNSKQNLESLTQVFHWFIKQFDAIIGQFPVEIEIADNDPTKAGDQKEKVTVPNLAEGIAELLGIGLSSNINTQTLINSGMRTLVEAGGAKIHALETRYIAQAIADYLAFDAKEVKTPVGMTFTAGKTQLDELLQESEPKIPLYTYTDDRDFKAEMAELLFSAAIIRAVHYRKVGGDPKEELKRRFRDLIDLADKSLDPPVPEGEERPRPRRDFDDFIEQVETGFMNTAGIADPSHPYGRPFAERPRIRELGNTADDTDANI